MPAKKRVIVVKSLRDLSPKKQILVARKPTEEEGNYLEPSLIGNSSPSVSFDANLSAFCNYLYSIHHKKNRGPKRERMVIIYHGAFWVTLQFSTTWKGTKKDLALHNPQNVLKQAQV